MSRPQDAEALAGADGVARLLACARAGDVAAFGALVRAHQSAVRWQLRRLTRGDDALADDLAQETFVQAWRHLGGFDGRARFGTWLHRIAVREFLQHRRRPADAPWEEAEPADGAADAREPSEDPRRADALRGDVERALARLSEAQRLCIVHCYHLDLSHEEAAEVLGLPLGTVKSHLQRARAKLQQLLGAWAEDLA